LAERREKENRGEHQKSVPKASYGNSFVHKWVKTGGTERKD